MIFYHFPKSEGYYRWYCKNYPANYVPFSLPYFSVFFPREHWKCTWTSFFQHVSRALFRVHGHFLKKFTGKGVRSRALFWTFSRALLECSRANIVNVHGHFSRFTGSFSSKMLHNPEFMWVSACSRALFQVHGHFLF